MNIIDTVQILSKQVSCNIPLFAHNIRLSMLTYLASKKIVIFQSPSAVKTIVFLKNLQQKNYCNGARYTKRHYKKRFRFYLPKNYNSAGIIEYLESNLIVNNVIITYSG